MTVTLGNPLPPDERALSALVQDIVASGRWTNSGALVERLEHALAAPAHPGDGGAGHGALDEPVHVIATSSGTSALTVALIALGLPAGGEVITSPLTFAATALAIEGAGLVPRFAGVDRDTLTLDPDSVQAAITPRTVAILPVHLFGIAADPVIDAMGAEAGLAVVYDAAHAFGLPSIARRGSATAFSLHATKLLHTGEGGFIATTDPTVAAAARKARNFGLDDRGRVGRGTNAKLPELSAALGLSLVGRLGAEAERRRELQALYAEIATRSPRVRAHAPHRERALVMAPVRSDPTTDVMARLAAEGILARTFLPLTTPGARYAGETVTVAGDAIAHPAPSDDVIALPLHGRVLPKHVAAIDRALS